MTHFIIPEDEDQNWKNSEVMRGFLDEYQKVQGQIKEAGIQAVAEEVSVVADAPVEEKDHGILDIEIMSAKAELEIAINTLDKLASKSTKSGNENATYQIELASLKLKDLIKELDKGEK